MKRSTFNYIADMIRDYPASEEYIRQRRQELTNKFKEFKDENIGGGRALNKKDESVADTAITIAEDKELNNLKLNQLAVENALKKCIQSADKGILDNITYDIIYELYLREIAILNLDGIANKSHLSLSQVKKRRLRFFEEVARQRGISTK
ncbi:hypothetical protein [Liquorilactobacillus hordei]|uniref:hypothetical protein n=1 Tax=Liquorilactobacillus hordei TaxID=468911 RepID=UPI0039EBB9AF